MKTTIFAIFLSALSAFGQATISSATLSSANIGGAPAAGGGQTCDSSATIDATDSSTSSNLIGYDTTHYACGELYFTNATDVTICKSSAKMTAQNGSITGINYVCAIYTLSGNDLGTLVATSASVAGNNAWSSTEVQFSFSPFVTLTGGTAYAIAFRRSDSTLDAANNAKVCESSGNTYGGTQSGAGLAVWGNDSSIQTLSTSIDCQFKLWYAH